MAITTSPALKHHTVPAPLEDAEDRSVQVELLSFGLSEHQAEITVQAASKQTPLVKSWPCVGSGCPQASKSFRLLSAMMLLAAPLVAAAGEAPLPLGFRFPRRNGEATPRFPDPPLVWRRSCALASLTSA
jgi:hypothetical protein